MEQPAEDWRVELSHRAQKCQNAEPGQVGYAKVRTPTERIWALNYGLRDIWMDAPDDTISADPLNAQSLQNLLSLVKARIFPTPEDAAKASP